MRLNKVKQYTLLNVKVIFFRKAKNFYKISEYCKSIVLYSEIRQT